MDFEVGDRIIMKKPHPCGSKEWEVLRVGIDFRIRCCGCDHGAEKACREKHEKY